MAYHSQSQEKFKEIVRQVLNSGKKVLGSITLNPHPFADEIKLRPEIRILLVTRDNRTVAMRKVLNWLAEGIN